MARSTLLAAIVVSAACAALPADAQSPRASFVDLFDIMERAPLATPPTVAWRVLAAVQPEDAPDLFERESERWIPAAGPDRRAARRAIVGAAGAFVANRLGPRHWKSAVAVLERGCAIIRETEPPGEAERRFHHVANALLQAGGDGITAELHSAHALRRFPDDARLVLARAVAAELRSWPDVGTRPIEDRNPGLARHLLDRLRTAAAYEEVRAEALLRMGMLALRNRDHDSALEHLRQVSPLTADADLRYLAALFEGRALEAEGLLDDAARAYERAVQTVPGAQTAAIALSAALLGLGRADESERAVRALLTAPQAAIDPWFRYGTGDARHWDALADALRKTLG